MPRSKTGKTRQPVDRQALKAAVEATLWENLHIRDAAKIYNVTKSTLARHLAAHKAKEKDLPNISFRFLCRVCVPRKLIQMEFDSSSLSSDDKVFDLLGAVDRVKVFRPRPNPFEKYSRAEF
ncbi:hypothetical protein RN001_003172 [Aquatica leii]|uniref:HTH psq-type domain-containing protein n=1 Tax=Aquatica leii TaxID=1421715 RepID=A0AAN7PNB6_9COLE|nr:hypothetical protein RN001_003172 [Aquatica leii]